MPALQELQQQAEKKNPSQTEFGVGDPLLARTHFGDMSALHGMAGKEGEKAEDTKARMMMWAEFHLESHNGPNSC